MKSRGDLNTEKQNSSSLSIDTLKINDLLKLINKEDRGITKAINKVIPTIEQVVDFAVNSLKSGGRIFYIGAGTSGRLGVLDASEIPPTFSVDKSMFVGIIAGGDKALRKSIEGAEDDKKQAINDLEKYSLCDRDLVVGISCSGAAAYVVSALEYSTQKGAKTVYMVTNPKPYYKTKSDIILSVDTGPEIITGSTRMKAGTATKMVLNMISTTTMIKLGKVYGNLMVDLMAVNEKLVDRGVRIIRKITGLNQKEANIILLNAKMSVKKAILMNKMGINLIDADELLDKVNGSLRRALG